MRPGSIGKSLKIGIGLLLVVVFSTSMSSEVYNASVGVNINRFAPNQIQKIREVLISTGIDFKFYQFPEERGLQMLKQGKVALEMYRIELSQEEFPGLIRLEPAVSEEQFWLITGNSKLCQLDPADRKKESLVGMIGAKYFRNLEPEFNKFFEVASMDQIALLLANGRLAFSAVNRRALDDMVTKTRVALYVCDQQPILELPIYSFLHPDFKHLQQPIEAAYRKHFLE